MAAIATLDAETDLRLSGFATSARTPNLSLQHPEFRQQMRRRRREVPATEAQSSAHKVKELLLGEAVIQNARHIATYAATDGEIDLTEFHDWVHATGKSLYFPVMQDDMRPDADGQQPTSDRQTPRREMIFRQWHPEAGWTTGKFNIPVPAVRQDSAECEDNIEASTTKLTDCNVVLVPGVAFGYDGSRVGRGKGYYDRVLSPLSVADSTVATSTNPTRPTLLGICHDFQLLPELKQLPAKDIPVDAVVSPSGIHWQNALTPPN